MIAAQQVRPLAINEFWPTAETGRASGDAPDRSQPFICERSTGFGRSLRGSAT
jgi:hypothetical protein